MSKPNNAMLLDDRAQRLLRVLVERYIVDGQPVGSTTLAKSFAAAAQASLSPATIRNVMADLEDLGFVASPHTSAGRVPTVKGYRLFVDTLLTAEQSNADLVSQFSAELQRRLAQQDSNTSQLLDTATGLLSTVTQMAGLVTMPKRDALILRQIEFLPLAENRVLVVLVINNKEVQNRIISVDRSYSTDELRTAANYLNAHFVGEDLAQVRSKLLQEMSAARQNMDALMRSAVSFADQALQQSDADQSMHDYVLNGQTNLMGFDEFCDVQRLRNLFDAFNEKRDLLVLMDKCISSQGVQIFIGHESGYQVLDECSVVTAPYGAAGETLGVLAVIGPTRMAYDRVIPIVDVTARLLGASLSSKA